MREKDNEYETESEEEIDAIEEGALILDTLEELVSERNLENSKLETKEKGESVTEKKKKQKKNIRKEKI